MTRYRVGHCWGGKPGAALVTIVEEGTLPVDAEARRADDRLIGVATPKEAALIVAALNAQESLGDLP